MKTTNLLGARGEELVASFLDKMNFKVVCLDFRSVFGQIDLIVCNDDTLIFVEVKVRKSFDNVSGLISKKQQVRIINAAYDFIEKNPVYENYDMRFDLAVVVSYYEDPVIFENLWYI